VGFVKSQFLAISAKFSVSRIAESPIFSESQGLTSSVGLTGGRFAKSQPFPFSKGREETQVLKSNLIVESGGLGRSEALQQSNAINGSNTLGMTAELTRQASAAAVGVEMSIIVGAVIGGICALIAAIVLAVFLRWRRAQSSESRESQPDQPSATAESEFIELNNPFMVSTFLNPATTATLMEFPFSNVWEDGENESLAGDTQGPFWNGRFPV
jgi:hypothetical protein